MCLFARWLFSHEAQRFAYGLWRFRSTFLSTETKAGNGAKALLVDVHPAISYSPYVKAVS
jgi:hypothetical protein